MENNASILIKFKAVENAQICRKCPNLSKMPKSVENTQICRKCPNLSRGIIILCYVINLWGGLPPRVLLVKIYCQNIFNVNALLIQKHFPLYQSSSIIFISLLTSEVTGRIFTDSCRFACIFGIFIAESASTPAHRPHHQ